MGALDGDVAIVTGAGRNIGRATALALAEWGASVAVIDRDAAAVRSSLAELQRLGASCTGVTCDVTDESSVAEMVAAVVARLGRVDVLVNNVAATDRGCTVLDLELEEWRRVFEISVTSAFLCTKHVARAMIAAGRGGSIVNLGSTSGILGRANATAYPTAKAALLGLTRSLAIQLGPHGIRVNLVAPNKAGSPVGKDEAGADRNVKNLLGRPTSPEDVARAIRFFASRDSTLITGVDLLVDAGAVLAVDVAPGGRAQR